MRLWKEAKGLFQNRMFNKMLVKIMLDGRSQLIVPGLKSIQTAERRGKCRLQMTMKKGSGKSQV